MHLVLTLDVFALRLDAAIFAYDIAKAIQKASEKREFRAAKSLPSAFFGTGTAPMTQSLLEFI